MSRLSMMKESDMLDLCNDVLLRRRSLRLIER
jgi:hypothetical protein